MRAILKVSMVAALVLGFAPANATTIRNCSRVQQYGASAVTGGPSCSVVAVCPSSAAQGCDFFVRGVAVAFAYTTGVVGVRAESAGLAISCGPAVGRCETLDIGFHLPPGGSRTGRCTWSGVLAVGSMYVQCITFSGNGA